MLLEEGNCLRDHILASGSVLEGGDFDATSLHTMVQMTANGLGLTILPKMAVDAGLTRGTRLGVRPLEGRATSRDIGLVWRKSSPQKEDFLLLSDFFCDELATPLAGRRRK